MERASPADNPEPGGTAFGAELERFGRLLRALWSEAVIATGGSPNAQPIGLRLAAQFDGWLRDAASIPPWWLGLHTTPPFAQPSLPFGLPFGFKIQAPPAIASPELLQAWQHTANLMLQWSQLQGQLATHWNAIARGAVEKFNLHTQAVPADLEPTNIRKLYDLWIDCAEEAYAAVVHTDEFCRTQAALVNVVTALFLEQRRHVERFSRSCGIPTQSELDALRAQLRQMQDELRAGPLRRRKSAHHRKRTTR
jgi:hypothetical protein